MTGFRPIAIVGQACLLPGAHSPEELWTAVLGGRDLLARASAATWQVADQRRLMRTDAGAPPAERIPTNRGGYVTGFEQVFDPSAHRLERALVEGLDPLCQWLLHVGRAALADAGFEPGQRVRGGAVIGNLSYPTYALNAVATAVWAEEWLGKARVRAAGLASPERLNRFMSGLPANLLCESLQLTRGGFMVDAACASSLYAIKFACDWLASGRADVMVAGGVSRVHGLAIHAGFTTLHALSPSGRSRPLHAQADGLVPSEGAAVIVLKRLEDAQRDGSRILGVIRGVGLANDGRGSGLLVPSAAGQVRAMEAAYRGAGLRPAEIELIECHATGTSVGDATEIQSCAQVFAGGPRVALGSLKANLGHLLPVAGVAGLIKVLKAMEHGVRPAILHLDEVNPALAGTPLVAAQETSEWKTDTVRRAAINAFGFGGNNAHLLVEQSATAGRTQAVPGVTLPRRARCAIVAVAARVGDGADVRDFWWAVLSDAGTTAKGAAGAMGDIRLPLQGSAFPPKDLENALAQQVLTLEVAHQALAQVKVVPFDRTAVFVGMGCDADACRFGLNLRLEEFLADVGAGPVAAGRIEAARQQIIPGPLAATTLGLMPNVVANRLNRQYGCGGASCVVSAEQLSGLHGLELALRALSSGDVDAAMVGAVDVGAEPVHTAALEAVMPEHGHVVSDGACLLILKREEDARRDGDTIYALIDVESDSVIPGAVDWTAGAEALQVRCGYCHAADGLLHVAAAALALKYRLLPPVEGRCAVAWTAPGQGGRAVRLEVSGLREEIAVMNLSECEDQPVWQWPSDQPAVPDAGKKAMTFAAHRPAVAGILRAMVADGSEGAGWPAKVAVAAPVGAELMPRAPALRPVRFGREELAGETIVASPGETVAAVGAAGGEAVPSVASENARPGWADDTVAVHECFLEEMAAVHDLFLRRFGAGGEPADAGGAAEARQAEEVAERDEPVPMPVREPALERALPMVSKTAVVASVNVAPVAAPTAGAPVGPKFSREQLRELAAGKISGVFGPEFVGQDGFHRQVRMPMPPMLLADRVTGIDAVAGELGTGTIWTETDVRADAWYLHQGYMPMGITIESGQADLLLISWMGIDRLNRSERTYRLLGCEAEIKGPLPKVGDTLKFDIHIDGHAQLGGIRMFFFRYDLRVGGEVRLSVRHGQAGFFTDEELANSDGVIWDAATEAAPALRAAGRAVSAVPTGRRAFSAAQVQAFAAGRPRDCFGPGFELTETHTRTPRIQAGRMCFLDEVTVFEPAGGPWGRGYLRAVRAITPDAWFFEGHFKNDPCMPGTLMLEGAVQAMAFFLAALGCTVQRDGWRFAPAKSENVLMRCRGQCVPTSREVVYEVFVEEFVDGATPQLRASVMASVDGRKAFLCQGLTVELVQDWPLEEMLRAGDVVATERGPSFTQDGFAFDHRSLLACALGRPSEGFGPKFAVADRPLSLPRLPRPPYHFMTRVAACTGAMGRPETGMVVEGDFDFAATDWFFERSGNRTMPSCVLMEALLQPCGWLSSYARDPSTQTTDIFFRNLDGKLTWSEELRPQDGTLRVRTELTNWSELGTMIIVGFRVEARLGGRVVATMETSFGFFPGDAFANQAGLAPSATERDYFAKDSVTRLRLRGAEREAFPTVGAVLADDPVMMLDRVTGWWPEAGEAGLGIVRAEKDVAAADWFFQAHFMQDPVQPGSLGIEALVQLLQCAMRLRGVGSEWGAAARFEPVALGEPLVWKYRGQVVPTNGRITTLVELLKLEASVPGAVTAHARGSLWVDGKKIYETSVLAMRVRAQDDRPVPAGAPPGAAGVREKEFSLAGTPWLGDHRPSFTSAVVPLTVMLDELAAAGSAPGRKLTAIGAFAPARWLVCGETSAVKIKVEVAVNAPECSRRAAKLSVWREAKRAALSRYDEVGATGLEWAAEYPAAPDALPALDAPLIQSPYVSGETTHGPAFQVLQEMRRSRAGASCRLDAGAGTVPVGKIHPALLDGCTHAVPFSCLTQWYPELAEHWNGLPRGVRAVRFFAATPERGVVRCELRPRGLDPVTKLPLVYVQFIVGARVWCDLEMEFALLDGRPFVGAAYGARRAFMRGDAFHRIRFSASDGTVSRWSADEVSGFQWMPGQLETLFRLPATLAPEGLAVAVTAREHIAHGLEVHPSAVAIDAAHTLARLPHFPLQAWPITTRVEAGRVEVRSAGEPVPRTSGSSLFGGPLLEDLSRALRQSYVRHFRLTDPAVLEPLKSRPFVICANHQTAIESMLFTDLFSRWAGLPMTTVTRTEHAASWMGRLTDFLWRYPQRAVGVNPQLLFDRDQPESFLEIMAGYKAAQATVPHSLHLHVEGEQALSCRHRVKRMSAVIVDVALDLNLPILPLRYSGGLPVEPLPEIVSFPDGFGQQDYTLGQPLMPEQLRRLPRPKAAEWVVETLNLMTPTPEAEQPLPRAPQRAERIRALCAEHGVTEIQAAVILALQTLADPSATTRSLLSFPKTGVAGLVAPAAERAWHAEVAGWIWGADDRIHGESEHWKKTAKT